ncbi:coiled-coil domain-containing protein 175 [Poeciliopsis prolifica]|uniref:coiled-coil domain-containing protein 175 n=1 Tax=Poeciliopsis prolifica TaxID=188132 RepID=UPI002413C735|nr:coiled-coil domain-containing protein 175 [Poeciliopsis prolifica]
MELRCRGYGVRKRRNHGSSQTANFSATKLVQNAKEWGGKMASCLVPEFPAVVAALERLKDLERELGEQELPFSDEGCVHLTAIAEAVAELEAARRAVREELEVETIENSKLKFNIIQMTERLKDDILRDKAAARAANIAEIEQLRKGLSLSSQIREENGEKWQELFAKRKALQAESDRVRAEHEEVIVSLNVQVSVRYSRQQHLDETLERTEKLRNAIAEVERQKLAFQQSVAVEMETFSEKEEKLDKIMCKRREQIKQEKEMVDKIEPELEELKQKKKATKSKIKKLVQETTELQGNVESLKTSLSSCEQQLQEERLQYKELNRQIEKQNKRSKILVEGFKPVIKNLQEEISGVDDELEKALAEQLLLKDSLAYFSNVCKNKLGVEHEVRADYQQISTELERSRLQLEERIGSLVKYSNDIVELERIIHELEEDQLINRRIAESKKKELIADLKEANSKIELLEMELKGLRKIMSAEKTKQQSYEKKMTYAIRSVRGRYEALLQEQAALLERCPDSGDFDLMLSQMAQLEKENRETQSLHQQEVDRIIAETEEINRRIREKQRELEERMKMLKEVENKWREEKLRNDNLRKQKEALLFRKSELERAIRDTAEHTRELLAPREKIKAELEKLREYHSKTVVKQSSDLREMEVNMYGLNLMLGQLKAENRRLHLATIQMTEDINTSRQEKERYQKEDQEFSSRTEALLKEIQEGFRQDNYLIKGIKGNDDELLSFMGSGLEELKTRNLQLMSIITLMHQVMLEFSKRLGDKAIERWQNEQTVH